MREQALPTSKKTTVNRKEREVQRSRGGCVSDQGQCRGRKRLREKLQEAMPTQDSWQVYVTWRALWVSEDQHYFSEGNEPSPRNVMQKSEVTDSAPFINMYY